MKKFYAVLILCFMSILSYAQFKNLNNGWKLYSDEKELNHNQINGLYFVKVNDSTEFKMYLDASFGGDTICELFLEAKDENGNNKVFYIFDTKATYFFNVFRDDETERFSMIKFEYNEDDEFTTGFNQNGLGQNTLAKQIALQLLNGHHLRFIVSPNMAEFQEIKEITIPSAK